MSGHLVDRNFVSFSFLNAVLAQKSHFVLRLKKVNFTVGQSRELSDEDKKHNALRDETGTLYRLRWQIELSFRWLKVLAGFRHLVSQSENGVRMQFHIGVIMALLIHVQTGRRVSKYALICLRLAQQRPRHARGHGRGPRPPRA